MLALPRFLAQQVVGALLIGIGVHVSVGLAFVPAGVALVVSSTVLYLAPAFGPRARKFASPVERPAFTEPEPATEPASPQ